MGGSRLGTAILGGPDSRRKEVYDSCCTRMVETMTPEGSLGGLALTATSHVPTVKGPTTSKGHFFLGSQFSNPARLWKLCPPQRESLRHSQLHNWTQPQECHLSCGVRALDSSHAHGRFVCPAQEWGSKQNPPNRMSQCNPRRGFHIYTTAGVLTRFRVTSSGWGRSKFFYLLI